MRAHVFILFFTCFVTKTLAIAVNTDDSVPPIAASNNLTKVFIRSEFKVLIN